VTVALNPKRLHRVFYNLIGNAVDAMPPRGKIKLRFAREPDRVTTEIEDSGKGLAPEILGRLFEPFATHGKAKGTGLGLSICQWIVEEHGGTISAHNSPRGGAVFRFWLPLVGG
jgi:signal transduction histidine kinase